jgi:NADPH-dependent glutamate synthase beta subunit-like oxidoreductase/NAD-dependent dihydropyrimidine dehydrogenase PreA subunit
MEIEPDAKQARGVAIVGSGSPALQTAFSLARLGVEVKLITDSVALGYRNITEFSDNSPVDRRYLWPLLLQVTKHPLIKIYSNSEVKEVTGSKGDFQLSIVRHPTYINKELCAACGRCELECSVQITSVSRDGEVKHSAIHTPFLNDKSAPSSYQIDKNGVAPCHTGCPLGINVQGFISLLSKGKTDKALALISTAAPLAGILGRVCTHPCESKCNRGEIDSSVSIRALHRFAADNATCEYVRKQPAKSRPEKIAIIGSGPAGLAAAWELTRRGYSPTVFESHSVIGGMVATGIPRFRLPKEIREREIEAIKNLGVDIRTGITLGRDITYTYLKERGYDAFFLAIGAQKNNRLDIPGEDTNGVVDCMALLLALNLKVDTFAGLSVVVIGGGNAAIDAARSTLRSGAKSVTLLYRRSRAEMPANPEEVEETINEGINIEFNVIPVEILTQGRKVTGVRCQRTTPGNDHKSSDGDNKELASVSGTDFDIEADHVVVAIGQYPDASQLNIDGLKIDSDTGVIQVNPLTLETSIPGVFAGGDCIVGPNNVVEAMANGLRAAESMDRYIQGQNLEENRSLETPPIASVDLEKVEISRHSRVKIPIIQSQKRLNTFEETTLGISPKAALKETQRCLNCALCSQCMECATICQLGAVCHEDTDKHFDFKVEEILRFPEDKQSINDNSLSELSKTMALSLQIAGKLKTNGAKPEPLDETEATPASPVTANKRLGVFLCRCGGSTSSVIDFRTLYRKLLDYPGVKFVCEIPEACTEDATRQIAETVASRRLDRIVLAACRCCNLGQVCYSCTDRRQMCQQYMDKYLVSPGNIIVEYCNIREHCAWLYKNSPRDAVSSALHIITAGVIRALKAPAPATEKAAILPEVFILGGNKVNTVTAAALAARGYRVHLVSKQPLSPAEVSNEAGNVKAKDFLDLKPWPNIFQLSGNPGSYEATLDYGSSKESVKGGAILVDLAELNQKPVALSSNTDEDLLSRLIWHRKKSALPGNTKQDMLREITMGETAGLFVSPTDPESNAAPSTSGLILAARISAFLEQGSLTPRASAVHINISRCRGCGNCADICPYIVMKQHDDGIKYASVSPLLCLGCGGCTSTCPTGAISQIQQSDHQIISILSSMLQI